jgi:peptidoglycan/LPS O-acetylase OafA/YrhL
MMSQLDPVRPLVLARDSAVLVGEATSRRFYWLDWLRFISAAAVLICHARGGNWVEWGRLEGASRTAIAAVFFAGTRIGIEWVAVFFVLSGFLVGGKLVERVMNKEFAARAYVINRITRIWVPLVPALLLTAIVAHFRELKPRMSEFLGALFGLNGAFCGHFGGNVPLWSLAHEIWFYVIAGSVAVALTSPTAWKSVAVVGIAVSATVITLLNPVFFLCWVIGAAACYIRAVWRVSALLGLGSLLSAYGCLASQIRTQSISLNISSYGHLFPPTEGALIVLSVGIALVVAGLSSMKPSAKLCRSLERAGASLAACSYTLYLTHYPLLGLWERFMPQRFNVINSASCLIFGLKIASCLASAFILYLLFEARTPGLRRWLRR